MKLAYLVFLVGMSVILAGCTQLLSPASNLRTIPLAEGADEASPDTLDSLDSTFGRGSQFDVTENTDVPNDYSLLLTPLPNGTEGSSTLPRNIEPITSPEASLPQIAVPQPTATAASSGTNSQPLPSTILSGGTENLNVTSQNPATSTATPIPASTPVPINTSQSSNEQRLELILEKGLIQRGEEVVAILQLSKAPDGLSGFDIIIEFEAGSIAEFVDASLPKYGLSSISDLPDNSVQFRAVDLSGNISSTLETLELGRMTLRGISSGATEFSVTINALDDDSGLPMKPQFAFQEVIVR